METMTVRELKKLCNSLPDDFKIFLSSDEEGNNYHTSSMKFGTAVYGKDKVLILYPGAPVEYEEMLPLYSQEEYDNADTSTE